MYRMYVEPTRGTSVCVGIKRKEASGPKVSTFISPYPNITTLSLSSSRVHSRPHAADEARVHYSRRTPVADGPQRLLADRDSSSARRRQNFLPAHHPSNLCLSVCVCVCLFVAALCGRKHIVRPELALRAPCGLLVVSPLSLKGPRRLSQSRLDH